MVEDTISLNICLRTMNMQLDGGSVYCGHNIVNSVRIRIIPEIVILVATIIVLFESCLMFSSFPPLILNKFIQFPSRVTI